MHSQGTEQRNVTRLIRVLAAFVLVPTFSIGAVMLWDPQTRSDHVLHASGFAILAIAAVLALLQAPRIAGRLVTENA